MWEERDVLLPWQQTHLCYSIPLHSLASTATCYQCHVTRDRIAQAHLQTRVQEARFDWLTVKSVYFRVQQVQWRTPLFVTNGGWKPSIDWITRCRTGRKVNGQIDGIGDVLEWEQAGEASICFLCGDYTNTTWRWSSHTETVPTQYCEPAVWVTGTTLTDWHTAVAFRQSLPQRASMLTRKYRQSQTDTLTQLAAWVCGKGKPMRCWSWMTSGYWSLCVHKSS